MPDEAWDCRERGRSNYCGDGDSGHVLSGDSLPGAGQAGGEGSVGVRPVGGLLGFPYALQVGAKLVESGVHKKVLVIGADVMSSVIDYTDRTTCVIFGDGAGAVLLEPCEEGEVGLVDFFHEIDGSGGVSLNMPGGGSLHPSTAETVAAKMHFVHQDGQAVLQVCGAQDGGGSGDGADAQRRDGADLGCFIPHQANKRIILSTAERLGMPESSVIINIDRYGNTTAATIPLAMQTALEEGRLKKGDLVLLASVGAGFTVGATLLRWEF